MIIPSSYITMLITEEKIKVDNYIFAAEINVGTKSLAYLRLSE